MRLVQFLKDGVPALGVWNEKLKSWVDPGLNLTMEQDEEGDFQEFLEGFPFDIDDILLEDPDGEFWEKIREESQSPHAQKLRWEDLDLCLPTPTPTKILCVGLNYADHAREFNDPIPEEPVVFCKPLSTMLAPGGAIEIPPVSEKIDYEAELVVVIGKEGRNIPEQNAMYYVLGYTCGNDVSSRDWQKGKPAGQWFLGKSFDTFAPIGPILVTKDEIPNPNKLKIESRLNGQVMQSSNTSNFIFPIEKLISYISQVMTLEPGDLIFTGTPGGVGERRNPPVYLKPGDTIEVEIEKIGTLSNTVKKFDPESLFSDEND